MTRARGYTVVELMMAICVFAIGVTGIAAMQKVTVFSNQHAKNLELATHIAQSWLDMLAADATKWNRPSPASALSDRNTDTIWLGTVPTAGWALPVYDTGLNFGPAFDALGNPVNNTTPAGVAQAAFCTHIRLAWLYNETNATGTSGNGLIRAEVRVFWLRDGATGVVGANPCSPGTATTVLSAVVSGRPVITDYHVVQKVTAIRENTSL
jgi:Tfp pilus assembly protein FimT